MGYFVTKWKNGNGVLQRFSLKIQNCGSDLRSWKYRYKKNRKVHEKIIKICEKKS